MTTVEAQSELAGLRARLDEIDAAIVDLLGERFAVTRRVGEVKRDGQLDPVDPERERTMLNALRQRAASRNVSPDLVETLYRAILDTVVDAHRLARK